MEFPSTAAPETVFSLDRVSYEYAPGVAALHEVSLEIRVQERLALLGANGSGKSTLLWALAGLVEPRSGALAAFGAPLALLLEDEARAQAFRRRVAIVFQDADAQLFNPSVRDEVAFGPLHLGRPRHEVLQRVEDTLRLLDIEDLAERAPYNLSGGEKRKVALAAALAVDPEVLLLDEPLADLDPRSRQWLVELLGLLHGAGKTIVIATHELDLLPQLADRACVLGEDHTVTADIAIAELLADPDLLLRANLIHQHAHRHGEVLHSHPHTHLGENVHEPDALAPHDHVHPGEESRPATPEASAVEGAGER